MEQIIGLVIVGIIYLIFKAMGASKKNQQARVKYSQKQQAEQQKLSTQHPQSQQTTAYKSLEERVAELKRKKAAEQQAQRQKPQQIRTQEEIKPEVAPETAPGYEHFSESNLVQDLIKAEAEGISSVDHHFHHYAGAESKIYSEDPDFDKPHPLQKEFMQKKFIRHAILFNELLQRKY